MAVAGDGADSGARRQPVYVGTVVLLVDRVVVVKRQDVGRDRTPQLHGVIIDHIKWGGTL